MPQCAICKKEIKGRVWKSAHTEYDYCGQCMYDTHFDPRPKIDPFGNPRTTTGRWIEMAQPHHFGNEATSTENAK